MRHFTSHMWKVRADFRRWRSIIEIDFIIAIPDSYHNSRFTITVSLSLLERPSIIGNQRLIESTQWRCDSNRPIINKMVVIVSDDWSIDAVGIEAPRRQHLVIIDLEFGNVKKTLKKGYKFRVVKRNTWAWVKVSVGVELLCWRAKRAKSVNEPALSFQLWKFGSSSVSAAFWWKFGRRRHRRRRRRAERYTGRHKSGLRDLDRQWRQWEQLRLFQVCVDCHTRRLLATLSSLPHRLLNESTTVSDDDTIARVVLGQSIYQQEMSVAFEIDRMDKTYSIRQYSQAKATTFR